VSRRFAHEAKAGEVVFLALRVLILLCAGGVVTGEIEIANGGTCSGYHLLKLLILLFILEATLLLVIVLVIVGLLSVVILVGGGVKLLLLGTVDDEVGGVTALETAPK
jgi:hypothetical protein